MMKSMEQKQFVYGLVILVVALIFVIGGIAVYAAASPTSSAAYKPSKSSNAYTKAQGENQVVINNYYGQSQVQPIPGNNCNQQVTGYYNNQPIVQCIPSGSSSQSQETINYPSQTVTKVNVHVSGGYYPYPSYYSRYYSYPKYYPYPQYPKYPYYPQYPKHPYYPQKPWW